MNISKTTDGIKNSHNAGQKKVQSKSIPVDNIEQAVIEWAGGCAPNKPFVWDGKFSSNRWGPKKEFAFAGDTSRQWGTVYCWKANKPRKSQTFHLKNFDKKKIALPPLETEPEKDCSSEFNSLEKPNDHQYLKNKGIAQIGLNIKQKDGLLIIPVYSPTNKIISLQTIDPNGNKIFKKDHTLGKGYYFPIGNADSEKVFVCEGVATGASLHKITGQMVYCAFSQTNLDNVTKNVLKKYPTKQVVLCLDNDGPNTHKTTIKSKKNLIVLCPETKGDFNDFRDKSEEIFKLKTLSKLQISCSLTTENAPIEPLTYFDKKNLFIKGKLTLIGGEKACLKTIGLTTYLADQSKNWAYYSNETEKKDIRKICLATGGRSPFWLEHCKGKDFEKQIRDFIKILGIQHIHLDPPSGFENANDEVSVDSFLAPLAKIASEYNISITLTRNYNKTLDYQNELNRISGSAKWKNACKRGFIIQQFEVGSIHRKKETDPKTSMLYCAISNTEHPKTCLKFTETFKDVDNEGPNKKETPKVKACYTQIEFVTPDDPESLLKAPSKKVKNAKNEILQWLSTQEDQKALTREIKQACSVICKISEGRIGNLLTEISKLPKQRIERIGTKKAGDSGWKLVCDDLIE